MQRILITGSDGFIGSHFMRHYTKKATLFGFDRNRETHNGFCDYIRGDICDYYSLECAFEQVQPDIVLHLAAMVSRKESEETPFMAIQTNVDGTLNVVKLCNKYNARLIYSGSSEEYGTAFYGGKVVTEDTPFGTPTSIYSMTKRMSEEVIQYHALFRGLTATTIRFFMLYGPGEVYSQYRSAISRFIGDADCDKDIVVHRGTARQWCYIDDALEGITSIVERKQSEPYETYNIGSDETVDTTDLAEKIIAATGSCSHIIEVDPEPTIIPIKLANFAKMKSVFGWRATTSLDDGLRSTIDNDPYIPARV